MVAAGIVVVEQRTIATAHALQRWPGEGNVGCDGTTQIFFVKNSWSNQWAEVIWSG